MKRAVLTFALAVCLCATVPQAYSQWTSIAPGIDYRQYALSAPDPTPNNVFVTRMDRSNPSCIIDSTIAQGQLRTGRETVTGMATRYDDTINNWGGSWGQRSHVVVAVNGDGFTSSPGPTNGQVIGGWQAKRWPEFSGGTGFVWKMDRSCFMGGNVRNGNTPGFPYQFIFFAGGSNTVATNVNAARTGNGNELIVYTQQFAENTYTDSTGTEVLVEMTRPLLPEIVGSANSVYGTIKQIRQNAGATPIPFDHVVLSGTGTYATMLTNACAVGDQIRFQFEIHDYGTQGQVPTASSDWTETYSAIGCFAQVLKNGIIPSDDWVSNTSAWVRNPRTCVAWNANYIYFVLCDGRTAQSIGMTYPELGSFCLNTLGAQWATNQDGGGSSAMWVNGQIKNMPSDGFERSVANGLVMVSVQPKVQSTNLVAAQLVTTSGATSVRLGPGTNFGVLATLANGTAGQIVSHNLNGVLAKGANWWRVQFNNGTLGWVAETSIIGGGIAPTVTTQPSPQTVPVSGTANFSITASGSATLTYQWQKNQSNLSNGGHYSGVTTPTLTISSADVNDVANYRCVVTNSYGTATSNEAALTLSGKPTITQHPQPQNVCTGGTAIFTLNASGPGTLTYQWQKGGVNLSDAGHYAGTSSATLVVSSADATNVGSYRCIVSNLAGSTTSNEAPLAIDGVYAIIGLGGASSTISGISTDGLAIAGNNGSGGFIWSTTSGVASLGAGTTTAGAATRNGSVIVGGLSGGVAARWDGSLAGVGTWTTLPTPGSAWTPLCTAAQNGSPGDVWIGGNSGSTTGTRQAVRYREVSAATTTLTLPTNGKSDAYVRGVSDNGVFAGQYQYSRVSPSGSRQAMGGATLTALSPLIGAPSTSNEGIANAISHDGSKAGGWSYSALTQRQGTVWTIASPTTPTAVPFIGSDNYGEVQALNGDGSVVGGYGSVTGANKHAIIWDAVNGTRDLQTWLLSQYGLSTTGWTFTDVKGISGDAKVLAGNGVHNGNTEAWVVLLGAPGVAPGITSHPAPQTVCTGDTVAFTVAASGLGGMHYQWQHDGNDLAGDGHYGGVNTATLTITGADSNDEGSYACIVSVGCHSTSSNAAGLTVKAPTTITQQPIAQNVPTGTNVQFTTIGAGDGTVTYQWRKGEFAITDGGHYSGATTTILTVTGADATDVASYSCLVTAGCGSTASDEVGLTVFIVVPPDFDHDGDVDLADFATFTGCAGGTGVPLLGDCAKADFDHDGDVDPDDFGTFQRCYSGQGNAPSPTCAN